MAIYRNELKVFQDMDSEKYIFPPDEALYLLKEEDGGVSLKAGMDTLACFYPDKASKVWVHGTGTNHTENGTAKNGFTSEMEGAEVDIKGLTLVEKTLYFFLSRDSEGIIWVHTQSLFEGEVHILKVCKVILRNHFEGTAREVALDFKTGQGMMRERIGHPIDTGQFWWWDSCNPD